MKKPLLTLAVVLSGYYAYAQTWSGATPGNIYYNSGNVGIGTNNPSRTLDVNGQIQTNSGAIFNNGKMWDISPNGNNFFINETGTATRLTLLAGGNVGIGTINPGYKLDIYKGATGSALNITGAAVGTRNDVGMDFSALNAVVATYARIGLQITSGTTGSETGGLTFSTVNNGTLTEKMFINAGGNVGIGTTNPAYLLDANGVIHSSVTAGSNLVISKNTGASVSFDNGVGTQTALIEAGTNDNHLEFWTNTATNTGLVERMRVTNGGSLCIGTTNPGTYRLAVNGGIHSQSVNVDLTGWSDYVFKKEYQLPSLSDVKTYIDQNHHLPDMPSEQEVIKAGINLGEMNKLLTKKVEELTLYLIDQNKKLIEQNKELEDQRKINQSLQEQINNLSNAIKSQSSK